MFDTLLKAKDYSKLVPRHGYDKNGKPRIDWINPDKDRDQAKDRKGQQTMFDLEDLEKKHEGADRGYYDEIDDGLYKTQVVPLVEHFTKMNNVLAKRIDSKYQNYIFDRDTKELDISVDYETAKYMRLMKTAPNYAAEYHKEYQESTDSTKRLVNKRKRHMASKMMDMKLGADIQLQSGKKGNLEGFTDNGFPVVRIGNNSHKIFWEEIRFERK